tara:strand:- start:387 stop:605 length:219 start_codon:yes stop_codon:yes gene_type:complete
MKKLNIKRLIKDVGGARKVAEIVGVQRTAPYGWVRQGHIRSTFLEKITTANPTLNINKYFEERQNEELGGGT